MGLKIHINPESDSANTHAKPPITLEKSEQSLGGAGMDIIKITLENPGRVITIRERDLEKAIYALS